MRDPQRMSMADVSVRERTRRARALRREAAGTCARVLATLMLGVIAFTASAEAQPTADDVLRCRRTIVKAFAGYVKAQVKVRQKCNEAVVKAGDGMNAPGGALPPSCDPNGKIPVALARMRAKITS